ncbi:ricin B lectin domain-containing protein [Infundibulicybe gibba]|nr:ricin B lectin domain-containing protein [Infundibulicybe gibba]
MMSISRKTDRSFTPGVYKVVNFVSGTAMDLSGADAKTIIGWDDHGGLNQQWEFTPLGAGFSICSKFCGQYLTVDGGINQGVAVIGSSYPVSWALEPDDFDEHIWRITWPNTPFLVDLANHGSKELGTLVQLRDRYPFESSYLWRLAKCPPSASEQGEDALVIASKSPSISDSDTVVDAVEAIGEDFKLGGNENMTITTTTTTTTTVTKIVKVTRP